MEESNIFEKVKKVFRLPEILSKNKPKLIALESKTSSKSNPAIAKPARTINLDNKEASSKIKNQIKEKPRTDLNSELEVSSAQASNVDGEIENIVVPIQKTKEDFLYQPPVRRNK